MKAGDASGALGPDGEEAGGGVWEERVLGGGGWGVGWRGGLREGFEGGVEGRV